MTPSQTTSLPGSGDEDPQPRVNGAHPVGVALALSPGVVGGRPPTVDHPGQTSERKRAHGAPGFYLVSAMSTGVSMDTSWLFFGTFLGIVGRERWGMFAVLEVALVACGYAMRANVRRTGKPGRAQIFAWALCGVSALMAVAVGGLVGGLARVALGPVLGLCSLHLALGIEVSAKFGQRLGTLARVGRELRERLLSRLGLGDDDRDAAARTRDRAAARAARLATSKRVLWRHRRLVKAVRASGATTDDGRRQRLVEQVATLRSIGHLTSANWVSPWLSAGDIEPDIEDDVYLDTGDDSRDDKPPANDLDTQTPSRRTSRTTQRPADVAKKTARILAKTPDITLADLAAKLGVSERTAQRHRREIKKAIQTPEGASQ